MAYSRSRADYVGPSQQECTQTIEHYVGTAAEPLKQSADTYYVADCDVGTSVDRTMDDVVTPNFQSLRAKGVIVNNPMQSEVTEERYPVPGAYTFAKLKQAVDGAVTGSVTTGDWPIGRSVLLNYLTGSDDPDYEDQQLAIMNKAVAQAHSNASSAELSLLMVAAEGRKSVTSMAQILYRVIRIARAARKLDLKYIKNELSWKELQDRYMELRYAIRPLVIDAKNTQSALVESEVYKESRLVARGFASEPWSMEDTVVYSDGTYEYTVRRTAQQTTNVRAGVLCDVKTSGMSIWGLDQAMETAWEVLPFSFIIDWFVNVGDTIAAWTPSKGVVERASWAVVEQTLVAQNSLVGYTRNPYMDQFNYRSELSWNGQSKSMTRVLKTRVVNPSLSVWPTVNVNLDTFKLLDLTIILKKLIRS